MCHKTQCDEESEKFCKFFWELNKGIGICVYILPAQKYIPSILIYKSFQES